MKNILFLIGRVKSKEKELLSQDKWQRLAAPADLSEFIKQLKDTPYAEAAEQAKTFEAFESSLNAQLLHLKQDLFSVQHYAFEPLLWKKYDYHNFKILLKIKLSYKDLRKYLIMLGDAPLNILEKSLIAQEKMLTSTPYYNLLKEAQNIYLKNEHSFAAMDMYLDQQYFREMLDLAGQYNHTVQNYFRRQIDQANLKLWRSRQMFNFPVTYLAGGTFKEDFFKTGQDIVPEDLYQRLFPQPNPGRQQDDAVLQKNIDDQISGQIFAERFESKGILPILVFFRAVELELKNLKICYLRQARDLSKLTELLRHTYV